MSSQGNEPLARILIVDDHPAVREAVRFYIAQVPGLAVCGEATDVAEALAAIDKEDPDVVIVDISLKRGSGIDLIKRARSKKVRAKFLVWSMFDEMQYAERSLHAGAMGYVNKQQSTGCIVDAIREILAGRVFISGDAANRILKRTVGQLESERSPIENLSDRELEVLNLIGNGKKTSDIAAWLHLSIKTVETYRDRIRHKLDIVDGVELARFATQWVIDGCK